MQGCCLYLSLQKLHRSYRGMWLLALSMEALQSAIPKLPLEKLQLAVYIGFDLSMGQARVSVLLR